tara:strand:- start:313 stop:825 length:513 start_codon:yes stop_codon:yes gene_type:complete
MPIFCFENRYEAEMVLTVEPGCKTYKVPHLTEVGIRYSIGEGDEDRSYVSLSEGKAEFWCNAESCEIDIVPPTDFERLTWEICVGAGWCGGIVDGKPTHVYDLLPRTGTIDARTFAELAMRADGWPDDDPLEEEHLRFLESKFIDHLGNRPVSAEELLRLRRRPFDEASS